MVTIMFKGQSVGYVAKRIAATAEAHIKVAHETSLGHNSHVNGTLLRWDSKRADVFGAKTLNSAKAITLCRDKRASRLALEGLCPKTWTTGPISSFTFPCLVRPRKHHAAVGFNVCNNVAQAKKAILRYGPGRWYASPVIAKTHEYRVFVFQGYGIKVARRYCEDPAQIAWNIAVGGKTLRVKRESWPIEVVKAAIKASIKLGLDYAAVDVIVGPDGKPYVLEGNSAPGLDREETIKKLGKLLIWADTHEAPPPCSLSGTSYKSLIHPAA